MPANQETMEAVPMVDTVLHEANAVAAPATPAKPPLEIIAEHKASDLTPDQIHKLKQENPLCYAKLRNCGHDTAPYWHINPPTMRPLATAEPERFASLYDYIGTVSDYHYYIILGQSEPLPDGKKSLITDFFKPALLDLIQASPDNPIMRAQIMQRIKVGIPNEIKGYEGVKDWIEANVECLVRRKDAKLSPELVEEPPLMQHVAHPRRVDPNAPTFVLTVKEVEVRRGTCRYSCIARARVEVSMTMENIRDLRADDTFEGLLDELMRCDEVSDSVSNSDFDESDYEYENYEGDDPDDSERTVINYDSTLDQLKAFIEQNDPELYEAMRNNQ